MAAMSDLPHGRLRFDFEPGAKRWTVTVEVDGADVADLSHICSFVGFRAQAGNPPAIWTVDLMADYDGDPTRGTQR
jgi:hypothetical protein